jgi:hypothetical protein
MIEKQRAVHKRVDGMVRLCSVLFVLLSWPILGFFDAIVSLPLPERLPWFK